MPYLVIVHATFENLADAQHIYDQSKAVAVHSSVAQIGQAREHTSHCEYGEIQPDGSMLATNQWSKDLFGIVREGPIDPTEPPAWIQPAGAQDAYPLLDVRGNPCRVTHNGSTWQNNTAANTFEPGVFGWDEV